MVIGSELLSGRRRDAHFAFAVEALAARGLELDWCHYVTDVPERLTDELRVSMSGGDVVFNFGGIGATPDDHTRACAARAAGKALVRHREAAAIIEDRFGADAYPRRIDMANLPAGCSLIPNPVNRIAGFSVGDHHFVPGFPKMAWPMTEWVLDNVYPHLRRERGPVESQLVLPGVSEGQLIALMERFVERFPGVRLSCLPHMDGDYRETELGVRGPPALVAEARGWLEASMRSAGFEWRKPG
jgi:molybdopterin-biosynthesis enzyme MoeA-like protein